MNNLVKLESRSARPGPRRPDFSAVGLSPRERAAGDSRAASRVAELLACVAAFPAGKLSRSGACADEAVVRLGNKGIANFTCGLWHGLSAATQLKQANVAAAGGL